MKSLNAEIVFNALMGGIIFFYGCGANVHRLFFFVPAEVAGVRFHCVWRQTTWSAFTEFNVKQ